MLRAVRIYPENHKGMREDLERKELVAWQFRTHVVSDRVGVGGSNQGGSESVLAQLCPTLCDPVDCSPPGCSVHGILPARILEWVGIPFSRGSSQPRDLTLVSCTAGRFFTI